MTIDTGVPGDWRPTWFIPLLAELDCRQVPYEKLRVEQVMFDPGLRHSVVRSVDYILDRL